MEFKNRITAKIYILELNNMLDPKIEQLRVVAVSDTEEKLKEWYENELAEEAYEEDGVTVLGKRVLRKVFKKDGPLEYYNILELSGHVGEEWVDVVAIPDIIHNYNWIGEKPDLSQYGIMF